jgi:hypothetical protein
MEVLRYPYKNLNGLSGSRQTDPPPSGESSVNGVALMSSSSSSFDPETIAVLRSVLDCTVELLPKPQRTPAHVVNLASQLLSAAAQGHRSREALFEVGARAAGEFTRAGRFQ